MAHCLTDFCFSRFNQEATAASRDVQGHLSKYGASRTLQMYLDLFLHVVPIVLVSQTETQCGSLVEGDQFLVHYNQFVTSNS